MSRVTPATHRPEATARPPAVRAESRARALSRRIWPLPGVAPASPIASPTARASAWLLSAPASLTGAPQGRRRDVARRRTGGTGELRRLRTLRRRRDRRTAGLARCARSPVLRKVDDETW